MKLVSVAEPLILSQGMTRIQPTAEDGVKKHGSSKGSSLLYLVIECLQLTGQVNRSMEAHQLRPDRALQAPIFLQAFCNELTLYRRRRTSTTISPRQSGVECARYLC